ncbi:Holliday junction branch migration protein RuvA [Brachybacterium huguangmaarense]
MISTLTGRVTALSLDALVLDVGGVGFAVRMTPQALAEARHGQVTTVHTELVVREDSLTLFGFPTAEETEIFRLVQSVSGIGPRIALAVLAVLTPDDLRRAVAAEDTKAIARTPGIGPKVAQRMVLELKDRIGAPSSAAPDVTAGEQAEATPGALAGPAADVVEALVGLGWHEKAASDAVARLESDDPALGSDPGALLRSALRALGGHR